MPYSYVYSLILFLTIIICFIASFDKRIRFDHYFIPFIKAAVLVAIPFIAWDIWFTNIGVWWFNTNYTLGITLVNLPVEEWLFFICIPFSCVFTYYCIDKFYNLSKLESFNNMITFAIVIICAVTALINCNYIYTFITAILTSLTLLYLHFIAHARWLTQATMVYLVLMLGFFPVNGVLTGTGLPSPVVNYNEAHFMGIRMLTIPVEDAVYGYAQFIWVLYFFNRFKAQKDGLVQKN